MVSLVLLPLAQVCPSLGLIDMQAGGGSWVTQMPDCMDISRRGKAK